MPPPVLRAYIAKRDQLEAAESVLWLNRLTIGTGSYDANSKWTADRIRNEWQRIAQGAPAAEKPKTAAERLAMARASGIGVTRVAPKEKPNG